MFNRYDDVKLIGLVGKAGSGKDTLADAMAVDGWEKVAFADSLKHLCMDYLGLSRDDAYTQEGKMRMNHDWGMTNRAILQKVGTEAMRNGFDKDVWVKILMIKIKRMLAEGKRVIVTDCRFDNECQMVEDLGGIVVEIVRDVASNLSGEEQQHASEQPVSRKYVSFTVDNNRHPSKLRQTLDDGLRLFAMRCSDSLDAIRRGVENRWTDEAFASKALLEMKKFLTVQPDATFASGEAVRLEWGRGVGITLNEKGIILKWQGSGAENMEEFQYGDIEKWRRACELVSSH